eukprot:1743604-Prymnesium_polylepis.2
MGNRGRRGDGGVARLGSASGEPSVDLERGGAGGTERRGREQASVPWCRECALAVPCALCFWSSPARR